MEVKGRAALITGGGTGVGRATALELGRRGCAVAVNYSRSRTEAEETVGELEELGAAALAVQADVADDASCRRLVAEVVERFGRLDVLVNSAGTTTFIPHSDLEAVRDEDWDRILAVNLKGPFQVIRAAGEHLRAAGGEVVNVASIAGTSGFGSSIPYCASKAALINLTLTLARVLAPEVRVNAVAPGFITGRWLERGLGDAYREIKRISEARNALRRVCDPADVAAAIVGLIAGSDLVTGQTLLVDGGAAVGPRIS